MITSYGWYSSISINPHNEDSFLQNQTNKLHVYTEIPAVTWHHSHYSDIIVSVMVSQTTGILTVCSTCLFRHRSKKISKLCVIGFCEWNSPHKRPVMQKMFPFDDIIMASLTHQNTWIPTIGYHCRCLRQVITCYFKSSTLKMIDSGTLLQIGQYGKCWDNNIRDIQRHRFLKKISPKHTI